MIKLIVLNQFLPLALSWLTTGHLLRTANKPARNMPVPENPEYASTRRSNQASVKNVNCDGRSQTRGYWKKCCYPSGLHRILQLVWEAEFQQDWILKKQKKTKTWSVSIVSCLVVCLFFKTLHLLYANSKKWLQPLAHLTISHNFYYFIFIIHFTCGLLKLFAPLFPLFFFPSYFIFIFTGYKKHTKWLKQKQTLSLIMWIVIFKKKKKKSEKEGRKQAPP